MPAAITKYSQLPVISPLSPSIDTARRRASSSKLSQNQSQEKLVLHDKIKQTLRQLEQEKKATRDLESRSSSVRERIARLEQVAPQLQSAQDSYYSYNHHFGNNNNNTNNNNFSSSRHSTKAKGDDESMRSRSQLYDPRTNPEGVLASRESQRLNSASRLVSGSNIPTAPIATSALTSLENGNDPNHPNGNNEKVALRRKSLRNIALHKDEKADLKFPKTTTAESYEIIADPSSTAYSNSGGKRNTTTSNEEEKKNSYYLTLQQRKQAPATHVFPNVSTFFSHPPRDERGFLIASGRSSKRTAHTRTYTGECILGASEEAVNRDRFKRAEQIYLDKEKDAIAKARAEKKKIGRQQEDAEEEGEDDVDLYPVKPSVRPTVLYTPRDKKQPGMSKTAELAVHMMPPAGKSELQLFESGDHQFKSSRRTLFYTDYTGKRFMIDACDMPKRDGFVLTGF